MKSYFDNMTSFTLFKPNGIEAKFLYMRSQIEAEALVAAMFTFSARFHSACKDPNRVPTCPPPSYFADIASKQLRSALDSYEDTTPPLYLLQASVLDAFYHITRNVRSKSWTVLGKAIRLAYDMKLHLVDVHSGPDSNMGNIATDVALWSMLEERRRAWWALWEMDVFASAIRRLPMAIDGTQNFTFLPVPDQNWLECDYQASCFLSHDPSQRWKLLSKTGNTSPKAWFIVINSLVQNARLLVYNPSPTTNDANASKEENLTLIANALYCATTSMPTKLVYEGQYLDFKTKGSPQDINCRQYHSDIYSIHIMTQFVHFMIDHHLFWSQDNKSHSDDDSTKSSDFSSWFKYMKVPEKMVAIIRNSSHEHVKYVNPCLTNALWFAAAAQTACRIIGPPSRDKMLAPSNYDLLELTIERGLSFWGSADVLKPRLARIEAGFRSLTDRGSRTQFTENLASEDNNARAGGSSTAGVKQPTTQSCLDILSVDHQVPLSETGAATMETDLTSFNGMLHGSDDPAALQLIFDGLENFLPYGMDETFWPSERFFSRKF
ncbi:hypothetical protein J3459_018144 [Metarhizium acridum]|nr:hypothetical protein J3459_018144 [Metarhizium acridum]